jgi:hypothetical protein
MTGTVRRELRNHAKRFVKRYEHGVHSNVENPGVNKSLFAATLFCQFTG